MNGEDRKGNKYPKFFSITVPTKGARGNTTTVEERGDLTCFILAHKKRWDEYRDADVDEAKAGKKEAPEEDKGEKQKPGKRVAVVSDRKAPRRKEEQGSKPSSTKKSSKRKRSSR